MRRFLLSLLSLTLASTALIASPALAAPPGTPVISLGDVTDSSIQVSWTADAGGGTNTYDATISPNTGAVGTLLNTTDTTTTFTGLDPNVAYTVTVVADNGEPPEASASRIITTDFAPPGTPAITVGAVTSSTIAVSWTATAGGGTNTYDVSISPDAGAAGTETDTLATSTTFTGLRPGIEYTISVVADNGEAATSSSSATATTSIAAPGTPSIQLDSATQTTLQVSWTATPNGEAPTYEAFLTPAAAGGTVAAGSTATTTTFTGLTVGTSYEVTVLATNSAGTTSNTATFSTGAVQAPGDPVITFGAVTSSSIPLSWTSTAGGGTNTYDVTATPPAGGGTLTGSSATSTTLTGLDPNVEYTVTVTATNAGGSASSSASATTAVAAPGTPAISIGTVTTSSIAVAWTSTNGGGTNRYDVTISPGAGAAGTLTASTSTSTTFTGLDPNVAYTITVVARNASPTTASSTATATTDIANASAPTNVVAELAGSDNQAVRVVWSPPTDDGGSPVVEYVVRLSNGATAPPVGGAGEGPFEYEFVNVPKGSTVTATVAAVNAGGEGPESGPSNAVTTADVPAQVSGLTGSWAGSGALNSMDLSWSAADGNGDDVDHYEIILSPNVSADPILVEDATSTTVSGLDPGTTYTVSVRAVNGIGNGPASSSISVLIPTTPGAVVDLEVSQSRPYSSVATVSWKPPSNSGGAPVVNYVVELGGVTQTVDAATTSVVFSDLAVGEYTATVMPVTRAGDGPVSTSASFEVRGFGPFANEDDFLRQLHQDMYGRPIDAGSLSFWKGQTADDGSNMASVVRQFMEPREYALRRPVARLYLAYFNRRPEKGGFDYWTEVLVTQTADLQFTSDLFAASPEFLLTYGSLDDAEFIVLVYNNVLDRRPDRGGFNYWYGLLSSGSITRGQMMTFFSDSDEFVRNTTPAVNTVLAYHALLQRRPTVDEFKTARTDLRAGDAAFDALLVKLFESEEFAARVDG